jgi:RNA recognition motif-containing protein
MNIYVGNLSFDVSEDDLRQVFESHGEVTSTKIIMDRETGKSRGFAFVEMSDDAQAQTAINDVNGMDLKGRELKVNQARPRDDAPRGGGGRGRY